MSCSPAAMELLKSGEKAAAAAAEKHAKVAQVMWTGLPKFRRVLNRLCKAALTDPEICENAAKQEEEAAKKSGLAPGRTAAEKIWKVLKQVVFDYGVSLRQRGLSIDGLSIDLNPDGSVSKVSLDALSFNPHSDEHAVVVQMAEQLEEVSKWYGLLAAMKTILDLLETNGLKQIARLSASDVLTAMKTGSKMADTEKFLQCLELSKDDQRSWTTTMGKCTPHHDKLSQLMVLSLLFYFESDHLHSLIDHLQVPQESNGFWPWTVSKAPQACPVNDALRSHAESRRVLETPFAEQLQLEDVHSGRKSHPRQTQLLPLEDASLALEDAPLGRKSHPTPTLLQLEDAGLEFEDAPTSRQAEWRQLEQVTDVSGSSIPVDPLSSRTVLRQAYDSLLEHANEFDDDVMRKLSKGW